MDTVVYGVVYDRLLSYTESVTLDLGMLVYNWEMIQAKYILLQCYFVLVYKYN
jgi:hypothetical protein